MTKTNLFPYYFTHSGIFSIPPKLKDIDSTQDHMFFQHMQVRVSTAELAMRSPGVQQGDRGLSPSQGVHNPSEGLPHAQLAKRPQHDGGAVDNDNELTHNSSDFIPSSGGLKSSDHTDISGFYTDTCPDARRAPPQSAADQVGFRV